VTANQTGSRRSVDWVAIRDERAHENIRPQLSLVESITADLWKTQAEILYSRERLKDRKSRGGKPVSSQLDTATVMYRHHSVMG
jgi:hypothetical protein